MGLETHAAVKMLTAAGASEALAVAVVGVVREAKRSVSGELVAGAQVDNVERVGKRNGRDAALAISAVGVLVAIVSLVVTTRQQTATLEQQTATLEQQTAVTVVSLRNRVREQLSEGGYRFEIVRRTGDEDLVTFVRDRLLFTIEAYVKDLETLGLEKDTETEIEIVHMTLQALATGFCRKDAGPVPAGPAFVGLGFPIAGTLADELGVMTCLPEVPGDGSG